MLFKAYPLKFSDGEHVDVWRGDDVRGAFIELAVHLHPEMLSCKIVYTNNGGSSSVMERRVFT